MWYQPELFDWDDPDVFIPVKKQKKSRKYIDYEALYQMFLKGPVRFIEIEEAAGVSRNTTMQVITTLSIKYPIYEVKRGLYKLYGEEEYGDGINHKAAEELYAKGD